MSKAMGPKRGGHATLRLRPHSVALIPKLDKTNPTNPKKPRKTINNDVSILERFVTAVHFRSILDQSDSNH